MTKAEYSQIQVLNTGNMRDARAYHGSYTSLEDGKYYVYAFQGTNKDGGLSSVERYDPTVLGWKYMGNAIKYSMGRDYSGYIDQGYGVAAGGADIVIDVSGDSNITVLDDSYVVADGNMRKTGNLVSATSFGKMPFNTLGGTSYYITGGYVGWGFPWIIATCQKGTFNFDATINWYHFPTMNTARWNHTVTEFGEDLLMAVGGGEFVMRTPHCDIVPTAEITYRREDDDTFAWDYTSAPLVSRFNHTANLLIDGESVLVVGGCTPTGIAPYFKAHATCEIYKHRTWESTGPLNVGRYKHTTSVLGDGRAVVVGGADQQDESLASIEIWDPYNQVWEELGQTLRVDRYGHRIDLIPGIDADILLISGGYSTVRNAYVSDCEYLQIPKA